VNPRTNFEKSYYDPSSLTPEQEEYADAAISLTEDEFVAGIGIEAVPTFQKVAMPDGAPLVVEANIEPHRVQLHIWPNVDVWPGEGSMRLPKDLWMTLKTRLIGNLTGVIDFVEEVGEHGSYYIAVDTPLPWSEDMVESWVASLFRG
jgi:hypothetical protein